MIFFYTYFEHIKDRFLKDHFSSDNWKSDGA